MTDNTNPGAEMTQRRNGQLKILAGVVAVVAIGGFVYWKLVASHYVSTDNAYTSAEIAQVTPAVAGTVAQVLVTDTQAVKQGEVLVRIDPTDAKLALAQADAALAQAIRRVKGLKANDRALAAQVQARDAEQLRAQAAVAVAQANFDRAKVDLDRREPLVKSGSVSGDELTQARNAYAAAAANLKAARAALEQAHADQAAAVGARDSNAVLIEDSDIDDNPEVALARARRDAAQVDLDRTVIHAPLDGVIAKRSVQVGQRVAPGAPLMVVVPVQQLYVDANFKEVQLGHVKVGQSAELTSDLYGSGVTYHGKVVGFSGGSGSAFAAIPAQNATGNWIKVVQRLPVRISLDPAELAQHPLKVGLSMEAEIDTHD